MTTVDPDFEAWVGRARDVPILEVAQMVGATLRRQSGEHVGPCPRCGGEDRFQVNPKKGVFLCRGAGQGDAIELVRHVRACEFVEACEIITGEPPPRSNSSVDPKPIDREAERADFERQRDREIAQQESDRQAREKKKNRAQDIFEGAQPISGTIGARYLAARGIKLLREQAQFIRFIPDHPYYHGERNGRPQAIGKWPAVVALMRDAAGNGTALHCTYLDPVRLTKAEIPNPDDPARFLNPRKMYGAKGLIWLSPIRPIMAIGEGVETTLSWLELCPDSLAADVGIAAAGDLGNMAGAPTGWIDHPRLRKRLIPNGIPDPDKPGMPVPANVSEIIFLGDADGDTANVRAHILTACRRHIDAGRRVQVHMSPKPPGEKKWDWNDEWRRRVAAKVGAS